MTEVKADPFNYPLRSPAVIKEEQRLRPANYDVTIWLQGHNDGDDRVHSNLDNKSNLAVIFFLLTDLNLSTL